MASNPKLRMDRRLYEAAQSGNVARLNELVAEHGGVLRGTTPTGNTCLHIATMCGRQDFALRVISLAPQLLADTNSNDETPLIVAAACRLPELASCYLREASKPTKDAKVAGSTPAAAANGTEAAGGSGRSESMVLKADKRGDTALHHAIRNKLDALAVKLLRAEPRLSEKVNDNGESSLFLAASRGLGGVVHELLQHPDAETGGPERETALHRAMYLQDTGLAKEILEKKPGLARAQNATGDTPLHRAANLDKPEMAVLLLERDHTLAYVTNNEGISAFALAANGGHVDVAKAIVDYSPDSAYLVDDTKMTAFHRAIKEGRPEFVKFVLDTPQLHGLLSQRDNKGKSPLHFAIERGDDPEIVRRLLEDDAGDPITANGEYVTALNILFKKWDSVRSRLPESHLEEQQHNADPSQKISKPSKWSSQESIVHSNPVAPHVQKGIEILPSNSCTVKLLAEAANKAGPTGVEVAVEVRSVGEPRILYDDIQDFVMGKQIGVQVVMSYISVLIAKLDKSPQSNLFHWIDAAQFCGVDLNLRHCMAEAQKCMAGILHLVSNGVIAILPFVYSAHWYLLIILKDDWIVRYYNPLGSPTLPVDIQELMNVSFSKLHDNRDQKGLNIDNSPSPPSFIPFSGPRQPDNVKCGYYVMRMMRDLVLASNTIAFMDSHIRL